jgi:hypothetical protein
MELNKSDYNKLQAKLTKLKAIDKTALSTEIGKGALKIARDMKKNCASRYRKSQKTNKICITKQTGRD